MLCLSNNTHVFSVFSSSSASAPPRTLYIVCIFKHSSINCCENIQRFFFIAAAAAAANVEIDVGIFSFVQVLLICQIFGGAHSDSYKLILFFFW